LAVDSAGNLFAASSRLVRKIDKEGHVTTLPAPSKVDFAAVALDGRGTLYVSDYADNVIYATSVA
jgi:hypothetical protein